MDPGERPTLFGAFEERRSVHTHLWLRRFGHLPVALSILLGAGAGCSSSGSSGSPAGSAGGEAPPGTGGTAGTKGAGGTTGSGGGVGSDGGAGSGGASDRGNGGSGGSPGVGGAAAGGSTGTGGTVAGCPRDFLKSTVDAYFTALAAHAASTLALASNVKFTENGIVMTVGQGGLWRTAGPLKFAITALDTDGCNTASEAVVPDGGMDIPFSLRLKLQDRQITEIESIAVRPGDYKVNGTSFTSNPGAIITSDMSVHWQDPVPSAQHNTAGEIAAWMSKYFNVFPNGVCNTASSCTRLENGGGSFSCSAGAGCTTAPGSGTPVIRSHIIFADFEAGIGVGFDNFMGNCDMHMFKMYGQTVYAVHAVLGACTSTGWD